jgi:hypothetical protein
MAAIESERQLRRAITELAQCAIEDIESVWSALAPAERERLQPLLAEASRVTAGQAIALPMGRAPLASSTSRDESGTSRSGLSRAMKTLPGELALRLLFCMPERERADLLARLPEERRAVLEARDKTYRISARARAAFCEAALAAAPPAVDEQRPPPAPPTLTQTIRRWIRRRA